MALLTTPSSLTGVQQVGPINICPCLYSGYALLSKHFQSMDPLLQRAQGINSSTRQNDGERVFCSLRYCNVKRTVHG